jgi:hypothetical protein
MWFLKHSKEAPRLLNTYHHLFDKMKKLLRFWGGVGTVLLLSWLSAKYYDCYFANCDGIVYSLNINVLFGYLGGFGATIALLTAGLKSKFQPVVNVSLSLLSLLFFWVLAEVLCAGLIQIGISDSERPFHSRVLLSQKWLNHQKLFWGDMHPQFARWRPANDTLTIHPCHGDSITIATNSSGARDVERTVKNRSQRKRVVMMGDSFVEGYLVNTPQRHSNLMEDATQCEHLNFGLNSTSPINYYLTYKHLAKQFEHDVVTVGILPANDFEDYTPQQKTHLLKYPIYRPYWEGEFPNASIKYSLAHINQSVGAPSSRNRLVHIQQVVDSVYRTLPLKDKLLTELSLNSYLFNQILSLQLAYRKQTQTAQSSFSANFFENRWGAFEHSLVQLIQEAKGKKMIFYLIPILDDIEMYHQNRIDDLSPKLEALCARHDVTLINLLPVFHAQGSAQWNSFYEPCDGHFTPKGEAFVAKTLLAHPAYRNALGLP